MPNAFLIQENIPANATRDILEDNTTPGQPSRLRFVRRPSRVTFAIVATATGTVFNVLSGDREVVAQSAVEAGGTLGVFPNMNEKGQVFFAAAGEQLQFIVRETSGVATTDVMLALSVEPIA